jgi:mono/diheme cytochrome c family protein
MTNAQKWVSVFLGVFILLFVLSKVVEKDDVVVPHDVEEYAQQEQVETAPQQASGLTLIQQNGCMACHGRDLKGNGNLGPSLYNAKKHWTRDELINYLRNPGDYNNDPRFDEYADKYKNIMMPSFDNLDVKDLGIIADYILSLEE